jgi:hypothetical protein
MVKNYLSKIVTGGQTGVDRAALDIAIAMGIEHGGWCPKFRKAEDAPISKKYNLYETHTEHYEERTEKNVLDSDGTLVILKNEPIGGTLLTIELANKLNKPLFIYVPNKTSQEDIANWIIKKNIKILNVAGPRESQEPGIYEYTIKIMTSVLETFAPPNEQKRCSL